MLALLFAVLTVLAGCSEADRDVRAVAAPVEQGCGHDVDDYIGPVAATPREALLAHRGAVVAEGERAPREFDRRLAEEHAEAVDAAKQHTTDSGTPLPVWTVTEDGREVARFDAAEQAEGGWAVIDYFFVVSPEACALINE